MEFAVIFFVLVSCAALQCGLSAPPTLTDSDRYNCPRADGMFAHPDTCRRFYTCAENHPYQQSCPPGLYFDDVKKHCQHKTKDLVCGPVPLKEIVATTRDPLTADKCDESQCTLPTCFCSRDGTIVPEHIDPKDVPQMVTISFDGALNDFNFGFFKDIIASTENNPNDCPATFTFFVSHEYSNYHYIHEMASKGHEIALNGIFNKEPETWWETASKAEWKDQMEGLRYMLTKYANLTKGSITGMRTPFIRNGGNEMLEMMKEVGITYDASLPVATAVPLWPYTFDYQIPHQCIGGKICPTRSFPGVWEYPLNMMFSEDGTGGICALADQCVFQVDEDLIYDFLVENFDRHYRTNRAPLGLYFHSNWFLTPEKVGALKRFIEKVQENKNAWFVSIDRALKWVKNPSEGVHKSWNCEAKKFPTCNNAQTCTVDHSTGDVEETKYMQICSACPRRYPWINNLDGKVKPGTANSEEDLGPVDEGHDIEDEFADENY